MNTPLSLESQIIRMMDAYNIRQEPLGQYVRAKFGTSMSGTTISSGLRGNRPFSNDTARMLYDTLKEIERAQKLLDPLPIDWRDVRACLPILERLRDNQPLVPPAATVPTCRTAEHTPTTDAGVFELVHEILNSDAEQVCQKYGWTKQELSQHIVAASSQLRSLSSELSVTNADRAKLQNA